jgi:hypothetical protein
MGIGSMQQRALRLSGSVVSTNRRSGEVDVLLLLLASGFEILISHNTSLRVT